MRLNQTSYAVFVIILSAFGAFLLRGETLMLRPSESAWALASESAWTSKRARAAMPAPTPTVVVAMGEEETQERGATKRTP